MQTVKIDEWFYHIKKEQKGKQKKTKVELKQLINKSIDRELITNYFDNLIILLVIYLTKKKSLLYPASQM